MISKHILQDNVNSRNKIKNLNSYVTYKTSKKKGNLKHFRIIWPECLFIFVEFYEIVCGDSTSPYNLLRTLSIVANSLR